MNDSLKDSDLSCPFLLSNQYHSNFLPVFSPETSSPKTRTKSQGNNLNLTDFGMKSFKILWIRIKLAKMGLYPKISFPILSTLNYETQPIDQIFAIIMDKYFSEESKEENSSLKTLGPFLKDLDSFYIQINYIKNDENESILIENECLICCENYPENDFLTIPTTQHKFCQNCVFSYLSQKIGSIQILHIKCPDDCNAFLNDTYIEFLLSETPELYKKYNKLSNIMQLSMNPNIRWCVRAGCDQYLEGNPDQIHLKCDKCSQEICFLCKNEWHEQRTCEQRN